MLIRENYFSAENQKMYMGSSQLKEFMECSSRAVARLAGDYSPAPSAALVQGQLMDSIFEGNYSLYLNQHPEVHRRDGSLLKQYSMVPMCASVLENDPYLNPLCHGDQQVIMTGEIKGVPVKIMIDSLLPDRIVDRKLMRDFKDKYKDGEWVPWWKEFRYDIQAAMYVEIYRQNTGKVIPFDLVAVSKEKVPDRAWVEFLPDTLGYAMDEINGSIAWAKSVKDGLVEPERCEKCEWCRMTKVLKEPEEV